MLLTSKFRQNIKIHSGQNCPNNFIRKLKKFSVSKSSMQKIARLFLRLYDLLNVLPQCWKKLDKECRLRY